MSDDFLRISPVVPNQLARAFRESVKCFFPLILEPSNEERNRYWRVSHNLEGRDSPEMRRTWYKSLMRRWMRDRVKRRNQKKNNPQELETVQQEQAPLQPTFLDRANSWAACGQESADAQGEIPHQPVYEAQPEKDPSDSDVEGAFRDRSLARRDRSRRRGRGGHDRIRTDQQQKAAQTAANVPVLPIIPGLATGEAAEINEPESGEAPELDGVAAASSKTSAPKGKKGAVVLSIGLPGSGKSSWFKRHGIIPLSSDLVRGLLFDDATEQRFQELVFSSLRSLLRARLIAGRPMSYIDATNLSPKERHSWIKMAHDFGYEAHAVFFDVPTEICMERNRKRSRNVPDEVMLRMAQKLRPPKFEEGFAKVIVVRLKVKKDSDAAPAADQSMNQAKPGRRHIG